MRDQPERLRLGNEPDAVPRARRFVAQVLGDLAPEPTVDDAELVVTELVTNALLHAGPPVVLGVRPGSGQVRLEVEDTSRVAPVRALAGAEAMTGRGLALVEALADRWEVELRPAGKVVWCELGGAAGRRETAPDTTAEPDVEARLAAWADEVPEIQQQRYTVSLGDVPTNLLLAAKGHVDNLVREFTLMASGAATGHGTRVPPHLATLIETVGQRFAEARQAIKQQAVEAARAGKTRARLTLTLPVGAADAGEDYLAALDQADAYARAARLLTLETPPQHRVFRHWYVESLVAQLRAAAAGQPAPAPPTFEQHLLDELATVATAQRATERAARLQEVTAAMAGASTAEHVAAIVVSEGVAALGASGGGLLVAATEGRLEVPAAVGYGPGLIERLRAERPDAELPAAVALRTGQPVWLESRQELSRRFPQLNDLEPGAVSMCALPLAVAGRVIGALRLSFDEPRLFDDDERRFVLALAAQTAQALERSSLYRAERAARAAAESLAARLARLQQVTADLAAAPDAGHVADMMVHHLADAVGAITASVSLLDDGGSMLRMVRLHGARDGVAEQWRSFPLAAQLPASEAVRTGEIVLVPTRAELARRFPLLGGQVESERALVCAPLAVGPRRLGALSLSFPAERDLGDTLALPFLRALADTCAQALDRAYALAQAREANDKLTFLAEASAVLAGSLDYRTTLANVARLVVPRLADWCSVQILEQGAFETVAVTHVDPARVAFAHELQQRYPTDPAAPSGVPHVVRTGVSELYPEITDEMLVSAALDEEHLRVARELQLASALTVPLTGRSGTFGAIQLFYAESGRHYDSRDLSLIEDLAARAAIAVENARTYEQQSGQLAAITRVAQVAQQAILPPVPQRAGPVRLAAAYVSAAREALVGGDLYEVVERPGAVRLLVGDVRGKGLDAVRLATVVLGQFRAAAVERDDLAAVARQMDARLRPYLPDEDFATAVLAEIRDDGSCELVSCGHPPALLASGGLLTELAVPVALPLGLGADPTPLLLHLPVGARLLLYTDGLIEARDAQGRFAELVRTVSPLATGELDTALADVLAELRSVVGQELGDDLALLAAEYCPR